MAHWDLFATILVTATIQSLFGVGVLLFGTPTLLLLGYDFLATLAILLPISLTINVVQVSRHRSLIDRAFYRKILLLTVPCIVLFLMLVTRVNLPLGGVISLFLILVALRDVWLPLARMIESLVRDETPAFLVMGIIHGLSNLGGSVLTALVHAKRYPKDVTRVTTAVAYGTFAVFQLLTLGVTLDRFPLPLSELGVLALTGGAMFALTERFLYRRLSLDRYRLLFSGFLFASGLVLIGKTWLT